MKTLFDYIEYYKKYIFREYKYNDVDALILAVLSYVPFEDIVPSGRNDYIYLDKAIELFFHKYQNVDFKNYNYLFPYCYRLMELLKDSNRYKKMKIYNYKKIINGDTQFSGITIRLGNITYISYRGTDSNIVGWREDFELMYKYPINAQIEAVNYLNSTINIFDRNIYVGGHSKGGNLSMYAYMCSKSKIKKRIKKVYNFDGPGFKKDVISNDLKLDLEAKLLMVVPHKSVVGMILNDFNYIVVDSYEKGIFEHNPFSWEVFGSFFVPINLSNKSLRLKNNLREYMDSLDDEDKEQFVVNTFSVFKNMGIKTTADIHNLKIMDIIRLVRDIKNVDEKTKIKWIKMIKLILLG